MTFTSDLTYACDFSLWHFAYAIKFTGHILIWEVLSASQGSQERHISEEGRQANFKIMP